MNPFTVSLSESINVEEQDRAQKKKKKKKIWAFENNRKIDRFNSLINLNIANISETQLRTKFKNSHKVEARNWHFHIQTCP